MRIILLGAALFVAACSSAPEGPLVFDIEVEEMGLPGDSTSGEPYLRATDSEVALSWIDRTPDGFAMRVSRLGDEGWESPNTISEGDNWFVNWADVPSITIAGDKMWAHWLEYNGEGRYSYGVRIATSQDKGVTWSDPSWLHDDRNAAEHGFAAMGVIGDQVMAAWLDGRKWAEGVQEMTVRTRLVGQAGEQMGDEFLLDGRSCDCCPNDVASLSDDGLIVAYRNRSEDEIRDIHVARYVDGAWEEPQRINEDGWHIAGCPVNGPALAARDGNVVIAWFTAAGSDPRVNVAFSSDRGATFGGPIRMDVGTAIGRVDVVMLDDGTAIASWIESGGASDDAQAGIVARRVSPDGRQSDAVTVVPTSSSRASGYPRLVREGDGLVVAWTGTQPTRGVKTARVRVTL
jgi:hypothetical protein